MVTVFADLLLLPQDTPEPIAAVRLARVLGSWGGLVRRSGRCRGDRRGRAHHTAACDRPSRRKSPWTRRATRGLRGPAEGSWPLTESSRGFPESSRGLSEGTRGLTEGTRGLTVSARRPKGLGGPVVGPGVLRVRPGVVRNVATAVVSAIINVVPGMVGDIASLVTGVVTAVPEVLGCGASEGRQEGNEGLKRSLKDCVSMC